MHALKHFLLLSSLLFSLAAHAQSIMPQQGHGSVHVCILGDSNAWLSGDDCSVDKGWPYWFVRRFNPASCRSYARSGATWTHTPETRRNTSEYTEKLGKDNVIYNQVERLIDDVRGGRQVVPGLVLICCGTNDAWFEKQRPNALSRTAAEAFADCSGFITGRSVGSLTALADVVRFDCERLMQVLPDAQIILITPPQTTNPGAGRIRAVSELIAQCAERLSLGCIRLDAGGCIYEPRERSARHFTYDGTHTSVTGARRNGCFIANQTVAMLWE